MKSLRSLMLLSLLGVLDAGCDPTPDAAEAAIDQELEADNGLSVNGLSVNGLSVNGLSVNGLSINGLSVNGLPGEGSAYSGLALQGLTQAGLSSPQFSNWFLGQAAGTAYADMVMRYVTECALPDGVTLSTTLAGQTYAWSGKVGLAPQWAEGQPIPLIEQQLVSACLAALINKFNIHVSLSMLGYTEAGDSMPIGETELADYPVKEGCFFGNLFTGEGVFVGSERSWPAPESSSRACTIRALGGQAPNCSPMVSIGRCSDHCVLDNNGTAYTSCTYGVTTYPPMTTRISTDQIFMCGDGICQISESCGTAHTRDNCADCGPCAEAL